MDTGKMKNRFSLKTAGRKGLALLTALFMLCPSGLGAAVLADDGAEPICGMAEHRHTAECYPLQLVCGQEESDPVKEERREFIGRFTPHKHTAECLDAQGVPVCGWMENEYVHRHNKYCRDAEGNLVCGLEEREPHKHTDECRDASGFLICAYAGLQVPEFVASESDWKVTTVVVKEGHKHSDKCWERASEPACGLPEHTHTAACYASAEMPEDQDGEDEITKEQTEVGNAPEAGGTAGEDGDGQDEPGETADGGQDNGADGEGQGGGTGAAGNTEAGGDGQSGEGQGTETAGTAAGGNGQGREEPNGRDQNNTGAADIDDGNNQIQVKPGDTAGGQDNTAPGGMAGGGKQNGSGLDNGEQSPDWDEPGDTEGEGDTAGAEGEDGEEGETGASGAGGDADGAGEGEDGEGNAEGAEGEDGGAEGEDGDAEGEDGDAEGEDGDAEGEDGNTEGEDGDAEGEDGDAEGEDGNTEGEDGNTEGEDGDAEGEDGDTEGEDGDAEGEDGDTEGEDGEPEEDKEEGYVLTAGGKNVTVEVTFTEEAGIPEGAELKVADIPESDPAYEAYKARAAATLGSDDVELPGLFDIGIYKDGEKVTIQAPVRVSIRLDSGIEQGRQLHVLHFPDAVKETPKQESGSQSGLISKKAAMSAASVKAEEIADPQVDGQTVAFEASGFSVYALAYTVDFHYNGVDYSIPGNSQILLSELIGKLRIMNGDTLLDVKDVASVVFTDKHLVTVQEVSGLITYNLEKNVDVGEKDFLLTSIAAFTSEEELTIWLTDGKPIVIGVTDAQYHIYLENETEYSLKSVFGKYESLGDNLFNSVYDLVQSSSKSAIWFINSNGYVYDYSYSILNQDIVIQNLNNIPSGDYIYIGFYDWNQGSWIKDGNNSTIWIYFHAPENENIKEYSDGVFKYSLDGSDASNPVATILGLAENYNGDGNIVIPATVEFDDTVYTVTKIAESAFDSYYHIADSAKIVSVTFNNTASLVVGNYAFYGCSNLISVSGSGPIASFGTQALLGASALKTVNITGDGIAFDSNCFSADGALESCIINGTVSSFGSSTFTNCGNLKSVVINGTIDTIGAALFQGCSGLESVSIASEPSSMLVLPNAFDGCTRLNSIIHCGQQIYSDESNYITVKASEQGAPLGAGLVFTDVTDDDTAVSAVSRESVSELAAERLGAEQKLQIKFVKISLVSPDGTESNNPEVQVSAYQYPGIKYVDLIDGAETCVYRINGDVVAYEPTMLQPIVSNKAITAETLVNALQGIYAIAYQYNDARYHDNTFYYDVDETARTAVISGLYNRDAEEVTIQSKPDNGDDIRVTEILPDALKGNATITGITFENENDFTVLDNAFGDMTGLVEVAFSGEGKVQVGNGAFRNCTALGTVTGSGGSINLADGWAFEGCTALTSVEYSGHVETIGTKTFNNCVQLDAVLLSSVGTIGIQAFENCGIKTFEATGNIGTIKNSVFNGSESNPLALESFSVGGSVSTIEGWAFNWCSFLTTAEIGGNATTFNGHAFNECNALETLHVGGDVQTFEVSALYNCAALKTVRVDGNVGTIKEWAFDGCPAMEKLIILGDTDLVKGNAIRSSAMRVAVFKGRLGQIESYAITNSPFGQENNLIYVGSVGGRNSLSGYAFGGNSQHGNAYFNVTYDQLSAAVGGSPYSYLKVKNYHYSDQDEGSDVYVRQGGSYGYGSSASDAWNEYTRAMYSMYNNVIGRNSFQDDCESAGVSDLGLVFYGNLKPNFAGYTLHVLAEKNTTKVDFPADLYGKMLDEQPYITNPPSTFSLLKEIVFENDVQEINLPERALRSFPGLTNVTVSNNDAVVKIGRNAFSGTQVNTPCGANQIVESAAGTVTIEKGQNAIIGTALVMIDSTGNSDAAVKAAGKEAGLFEDIDDELIQIKYFDLSLKAPNGNPVNVPAHVAITQKAGVYSGVDTVAPAEFGFFHLGEVVELATKEFTAATGSGTIAFEFDAAGFSPYAAAFVLDVEEMTDGIYTYLVDKEGNATIIGYGPEFSGNVLNIPGEAKIGELTCKVVGIKDNALTDPPEEIVSVVFSNETPIIVGSGAMSGLTALEAIEFNGTARVEFKDGTAFDGSGSGNTAVNMPNGLTAQTYDGAYGAVFSGISGNYTLELDKVDSIPAGTFKDDTKIKSITVKSELKDIEEFDSEYSFPSRGDFTNAAIGLSAFEGATALESFIAEGNSGEGFTVGNEAFKDCGSLSGFSVADKIHGIGENALRGTKLTELTLDTDELYLGDNSLADIPSLKKVTINGDAAPFGEYAIGGDTQIKQLVVNGKIGQQMYGDSVRADKLEVLVVRDGIKGFQDDTFYTVGSDVSTLTAYIGGSAQYCDDPYIDEEAFPSNKPVRIYLDLPITREEASQSRDLVSCPNIIDLVYSKDEAPKDLYVDTTVSETAIQNGSEGQPYNSMAKALEAVNRDYDHAARFKRYFSEAGYDASGLPLKEGNFSVTEFTLHIVGGTTAVDDTFKGDARLTGLEVETDSVVTLQGGAFQGCENLTDVNFAEAAGVVIGRSAFSGDSALENLSFGFIRYYSWTSIGNLTIEESAFKDCAKLSDFTVSYAGNVTVNEGAFENCTGISEVYVEKARDVLIGSEAFRGNTAIREVSISGNNVTIKGDAFRGMQDLNSVTIDNSGNYATLIEAGSFAGCGVMDRVMIMSSQPAVIKTGAFDGEIGVLRLTGGASAVEAGGFDGGTSYIDESSSFNFILAERIGGFDNIILNNAQSVSSDAQVFSGNDGLKNVYLGRGSATDGGTKGAIFAGMPDSAAAYVAHRRAEFTDENRPTRQGGALRFLDAGNYLYIDGTNTNPNPDGSQSNGFTSFEQAKEYAAAHAAGSSGSGTSTDDYYYTDVAEALRKAFGEAGITYTESDIRFCVPSDETDYQVFCVIGTLPVKTDETWDSPDGITITLLRYDGGDAGAGSVFTKELVNVQGASLTLNNVVLDGNYMDAGEPLILGNSGSTIVIHEPAQLRNNINTVEQWVGNQYTSGGAIRTNGRVEMDGGSISGNTAVGGGGINLYGGAFEMSGGTISDNIVQAGSTSNPHLMGGGVLVTGKAEMVFSGGSVSGNRAEGGNGAGIALGSTFFGNDNNIGYLTMTGGSISDNESTYEGGGLYIQMESWADISGGSITGNTSHGGRFSPNYGGGGVYVNGTHEFFQNRKDGVLHLTKAVIKGNNADIEGGAISACLTSTSRIYLASGSAIYGNRAGDKADLHFDYYSSMFWEGYGRVIGTMEATVSPYMWNGTPYNWIDTTTNAEYPIEELALIRNKTVHLRANPGEGAPSSGSVMITGNHSDSRGGGIGSNGTIIIGDEPEDGEAEWTPGISKVLHNRDMQEGETFTFDLYREESTETRTGTYTLGAENMRYTYTDTFLGTGTVTGGKNDVPAAIHFDPVTVSNLTAADLGSVRTYLVLETTPSEQKLITDTKNYFAFNVTIGMGVKNGKECYTARTTDVLMGEYSRDGNGKPVFNAGRWYGDEDRRIRESVNPDEAVFHNYSTEMDVSADKRWINFDGTDTPPAGTKVTFELYRDGEPFSPARIIELDGIADSNGESGAWTATWRDLPAYRTDAEGKIVTDKRGNYVKVAYSVKEAGIELPEGSYASYVNDEENAPVSTTSSKPAILKNRQTTGDLKVSKTVDSGRAADHEKAFAFRITLSDTAIGGRDGKTFGGMTFKQGVAEFSLKDGESKTATGLPTGVKYTVTETGADGFTTTYTGETGTIRKELSTAAFTNTYHAKGETTLAGTKQIENRNFRAGDAWTFTVTAAAAGTPMPERTQVTIRPTQGNTADVDFGTIQYTEADAGKTFTYTVTESLNVVGVTNDAAKTVTVKVDDNGDGTLSITNSTAAAPMVFVNTYHAEGRWPLQAKKVLSGRNFRAGDAWTFTVTAPAGTPMPQRTRVTIQPTQGEDAPVSFGEIVFTEANVGKSYTYTITETGTVENVENDGAKTVTVTVADNGDGTLAVTMTAPAYPTFTNIYYKPETTEVSGHKTWTDNNDQDLIRPKKLEVTLLANGVPAGRQTATPGNGWSWSFTNLPKNDDNGNEITYTVTEEAVPGYTPLKDGYDLINVRTPEETTQKIVKIWDDVKNLDESRPASVEVTLLADEEPLKSFTLSAANDWTAEEKGLPLTKNGKKIVYSWKETVPAGYTATTETRGTLTVLTNHHTPELTSVKVRKVWSDNNNELGLRPGSITVVLSNGMSVQLSAANGWSATVTGLPKTKGGVPVEYTWTEHSVTDYVQAGSTVEGSETVFTNTVWERPPVPEGETPPKVPGRGLTTLDDYETPLGVDVIINHVGDCFE